MPTRSLSHTHSLTHTHTHDVSESAAHEPTYPLESECGMSGTECVSDAERMGSDADPHTHTHTHTHTPPTHTPVPPTPHVKGTREAHTRGGWKQVHVWVEGSTYSGRIRYKVCACVRVRVCLCVCEREQTLNPVLSFFLWASTIEILNMGRNMCMCGWRGPLILGEQARNSQESFLAFFGRVR